MTGASPASSSLAAPQVLGCESCGLAWWVGPASFAARGSSSGTLAAGLHCPRCGQRLRAVKPFAVQRTWACLVAAATLYIPANALPIMVTTSALEREDHTLLGGIYELWVGGSWFLAIIVFVASIAVPVLKISVLGLLAWTVRNRPEWRRLERAKLFRLVEAVGHWSMLDVYVVVLLAATVRFGPLASVAAGPALLPFAAVVVCTLLATWSFDPRLIWRDAARDATGQAALP